MSSEPRGVWHELRRILRSAAPNRSAAGSRGGHWTPGDGYVCSTCGEAHEGPPLAWAFQYPIYYDALPAAERKRRALLGPENCEIDGEHFFVRGRIPIPVQD